MKTKKVQTTTIDQDARIDPYNLVEDMERHPGLFSKWSSLLSEAQTDRDEAKTEMELLYADYDTAIREAPADYNIERVTEGAIKNAIITQEGYQEARRKVADAERRINAYTAAVRTMEHRKKMLEKIADLWLGGYYSENLTNRRAAKHKESRNTSTKIQTRLDRKLKRRK